MISGCLTTVKPDWLGGVNCYGEGGTGGAGGGGDKGGEETICEWVARVGEGGLGYAVVLRWLAGYIGCGNGSKKYLWEKREFNNVAYDSLNVVRSVGKAILSDCDLDGSCVGRSCCSNGNGG